MSGTKKNTVAEKTDRNMQFRRFCNGAVEAVANPAKGLVLLLYIMGFIIGWRFRNELFRYEDIPFLAEMLHDVTLWAAMFVAVIGLMLLLVCLGTPCGAREARENLLRAGLTNGIGEAPVLLSKRVDIKTGIVTWRFNSLGIHRSVWEDKQDAVETALDISIISIRAEEGKCVIVLEAVPAKGDLPAVAPWDNRFLSLNNFVLRLGEGLAGSVSVDLLTVPHLLLGGSTGSGKSSLLKLLLFQAISKGAVVYAADLKGVDFPGKWQKLCRMAFDEQETLALLSELVEELNRRKALLKAAGVANVDAYNKTSAQQLPRIVFACDEVAELLDKTGRSKEQKELTDKIVGKLETLARQGRGYNMNLILATQRPDAQTMPGQIKNNLDGRICGKADQVLSQIILDNTDAATMIPKDSRGRFLFGKTLFQAYWFDENEWRGENDEDF